MRFRHAGDQGDIVYAMPAMKAKGGGELLIEAVGWTRQTLTPEVYAPLEPLLLSQPYIKSVRPYQSGEHHDVNFNNFRPRMVKGIRMSPENKRVNLADWQLDALGLPRTARDEKWIDGIKPNRVAEVVINRTMRYRNPFFPWGAVLGKYERFKIKFIGAESEHEDFCRVCGPVPFYKTANLLEAAEVIAGSDLFIGNQSLCYAIAEGMKHRAMLEVWLDGPNCLFYRGGVFHGWDSKSEIP